MRLRLGRTILVAPGCVVLFVRGTDEHSFPSPYRSQRNRLEECGFSGLACTPNLSDVSVYFLTPKPANRPTFNTVVIGAAIAPHFASKTVTTTSKPSETPIDPIPSHSVCLFLLR